MGGPKGYTEILSIFGIAAFGIAVFGITIFGIAGFGIATFGIAIFGIAAFGITDCTLLSRPVVLVRDWRSSSNVIAELKFFH